MPIRLFVSDGSTYDVRHPEMLLVSRTEIVVGLAQKEEELPERLAFLDPLHITRVEPVNGSCKG